MRLRSRCFLWPAVTWDREAFLHLPLSHLWDLEVLSIIRFWVVILRSTRGSSGCCENSRHAQTPFLDFAAWLPFSAHHVALRYLLNAKILYVFRRNLWFHRNTFWTTVLTPRVQSHSSLRQSTQPGPVRFSSHWVFRSPKLHSPNTADVSRLGDLERLPGAASREVLRSMVANQDTTMFPNTPTLPRGGGTEAKGDWDGQNVVLKSIIVLSREGSLAFCTLPCLQHQPFATDLMKCILMPFTGVL